MENDKATTEYVFEDEFSFVTRQGKIYRKASGHLAEKEVGETNVDNIEKALEQYRNNLAALKEELDAMDRSLTEDEASGWKAKLDDAEAIGDVGALYDQVEALVARKDEPAEVEAGKESTEETPEREAPSGLEEEDPNDPAKYYKELLEQAHDATRDDDWQHGTNKLNELSHQWSDGPEAKDEETEEKVKDLYYKFTKVEDSFRSRKETHFAEAEKERKQNLSDKREIISQVEKIVNDENWSATGKIKSLENKWHHVGAVPSDKADDLNETFTALVKEFKSHKVDRLVEKRQHQEDNLMMKMAVLDKMEKVPEQMSHETENWKELEDHFSDLTRQWKKIGRVPREKSNQVWSRYKAAQDAYYDQKYRFDKDHRSKVDSFTAKKENVIADAEALVEQKDIAKAARKVNKLHRRWKKIGNLPQRKEDELWDRFKAATDAFNEKKANNSDKIQEQEEKHYRQKLELIEKAEEAKTTTEWDKGHQQMQSYMDRWKKIGPVPRKKSGEIWKQFKGAMDVFYDRRREHFKEAKEEQKENLKKKEEILEKLRELGHHEDPIEAVNEAKKLQAQFKDIGYVPIKKKNEMWKRYREVCDVIYDRMRAAKSGNRFDQELAKADLDADQRSQIQNLRKQYKKVRSEVETLKKEVLQLEESKTNFNFSDDDNPFLKEINDKVSKAQAKLESRQNKLDAISMEMEDIREEA